MVKYIVPVPDATHRSGLLASKQAKAGPAGCSRVAAAAALAITARETFPSGARPRTANGSWRGRLFFFFLFGQTYFVAPVALWAVDVCCRTSTGRTRPLKEKRKLKPDTCTRRDAFLSVKRTKFVRWFGQENFGNILATFAPRASRELTNRKNRRRQHCAPAHRRSKYR